MTPHAPLLKKLPSWLFKLGAQSWIDKEWPRHLFIETTAACNLTCEYCPREKVKNHMDFNLFRSIIDEGRTRGPRSYSLHLFGEPLLYPKIFEACRYIRRAHRRNAVLLTTNGTLINRYVDQIREADPDLILWTWRTEAKFTQETKEKLRKWGKFRVRFINEITPESAREEWKDWPNIEDRRMHNYGGEINVSRFLMGVGETGVNRWPCYHLWLAPAIAWNGNILICCADPHQKEIIGKLPETSISKAWQSEQLKKIRESHLKGEYGGICTNCDVWKEVPNLFYSWQHTS